MKILVIKIKENIFKLKKKKKVLLHFVTHYILHMPCVFL